MQQSTNAAERLRIIRLPEVIRKTGLSKSTIYDKLRNADFPVPVILGDRAIGFIEGELDAWMMNLPRQLERTVEMAA
jgi:prophage regulatory protein